MVFKKEEKSKSSTQLPPEKWGFLKENGRWAHTPSQPVATPQGVQQWQGPHFCHQQSTSKYQQCEFKAGVWRKHSRFNMNFFGHCGFHLDRTSQSRHFLNSTFKLPLNSILKFTQTSGNYLPNQLGSEEYCNFHSPFFLSCNS